MNLNGALSLLDSTILHPNQMRSVLYFALTRIEQLEREITRMKEKQTEQDPDIRELFERTGP